MYTAPRCAAHDKRLTWNTTGPAGATGPAGETGPAGAAGATGAQGKQGEQGLQGLQGVPGPTHVYSVQGPDTTFGVQSATTIATLNLPTAGIYVVNATFYIRAEDAGSYEWLATCTLADGSSSDLSQAGGQETGGGDGNAPMALSFVHTATAPDTVTLSCYQQGSSDLLTSVDSPVITAVEVGASN